MTLGEAAQRLGVGKDVARRWCKNGRLPAVRRGLWWQVDREGIERVIGDTGAEPVQVRETLGESCEQVDREELECTVEDTGGEPVQVEESREESCERVDREELECTVEDTGADPVQVGDRQEESCEP